MFSSHLPQTHTVPREYLIAGAGLLIVVSLLVGIAMVATGQVKKAEAREFQLASQRTAIAQCMERLGGTELNVCIVQAQASPEAGGDSTTTADSNTGFTRSQATGPGFIPVAFSTHR